MRRVMGLVLILFVFYMSVVPVFGDNSREVNIAGGVVPHHLLAKEIIEDFFEFIAGQEQHPETIILLSPDHFNCSATKKENSFISVGWKESVTELKGLSTDIDLLKNIFPKQKLFLSLFPKVLLRKK